MLLNKPSRALDRVAFDVDTIRTRLREVAFLNKTATISFNVTGAPSSNGNGAGAETFHFSGGIAEFVAWNNRARIPMHDPIYVCRSVGCLPSPANLMLTWRPTSNSGMLCRGCRAVS